MVKCKECGEEIGYITSNATATTCVTLFEDGEMSLDNEDLNSIIEIDEWRCPECDEIVAYNEDEARDFMKDKDELQEIVKEKIESIKDNDRD